MSRDLAVYAGNEQLVALDDVLAYLSAKGTPATWRSRFGGSETAGWRKGDLVAATAAEAVVGISYERTDDYLRDAAVAAYGPTLSDALRPYLSAADVVYRMTARDVADADLATFLTNVADAFATLGDGIVVEQATGAGRLPGAR